ncbi:MAG TPA: methyltransferase domain-containing protein [Bryobacteraceae bacterium]|nr:methyltransferase domain-containing protein [Bryobacteraceae bacterium]
MAEFTGERLIPGEVDADLLNEHMARYTFAARLARGKRVLDAGCGAGYGSAEMAHSALSVMGADIAAEAISYARANYRLPNLNFLQSSCAALPFKDSTFDLIVAFEVIEHLENFSSLLLEARRLLAPNGQFIVSTPNKLYYTESRGQAGANPFHVHEFQFDEFRSELKHVFPHVSLFLENHVEGVTFQPHERGHTVEVRVDAGETVPDESHFFLAVCAHRPQLGNPTFVYIPRTGNVLREREHHIAALEGEVELKTGWLKKAQADLAEFDRLFRQQKEELEKSNRWAEQMSAEVKQAGARIVELQQELEREQDNAREVATGYEQKVQGLEADLEAKIAWAKDAEKRLEEQIADKKRAVEALHRTEKELEERTAWAQKLEQERSRLEGQVTLYRGSRWVRLGRKVGLGPEVPTT